MLPSPPAGNVHELPFTVEPLNKLDELPLMLQAVTKFSGILLELSALGVVSLEHRAALTLGVNVVKL